MVVELLRQRGAPVRALVRRDDERADALRATGAEVVVGDLTNASDVARALAGCRRMYFGMSVSAAYLEATVIAAAAARERVDLEVFVNISQMTVSQMSLTQMTGSPQHRQHLLAESVLNWSGLPVVHVRPTVFLENPFFLDWAAESIAREGVIRLPFGTGRTSPVACEDVAEVMAAILTDPSPQSIPERSPSAFHPIPRTLSSSILCSLSNVVGALPNQRGEGAASIDSYAITHLKRPV